MKTISEIAGEYYVHPNQVSKWKKQFLENAEELFSSSKPKDGKEQADKENEVLYAKIDRLEIELDFLKKVEATETVSERKQFKFYNQK